MKIGDLAIEAQDSVDSELKEKAVAMLKEKYRELRHAERVVERLTKQLEEFKDKDLIELDCCSSVAVGCAPSILWNHV